MAFIIGLDFDGTLVEHEFPEIGPPVPGAFEWVRRWQDAGASLVLWTMRSDGRERLVPDPSKPEIATCNRAIGPVLTEAVLFCQARGLKFWGVNANPQQHTWTQSPKAYCHVYVDDAAACCPLLPNPRSGKRPYVDFSIVGPAVLALIPASVRPPA